MILFKEDQIRSWITHAIESHKKGFGWMEVLYGILVSAIALVMIQYNAMIYLRKIATGSWEEQEEL